MTSESKRLPKIETALLTDGDMRASILNYGAITQGWWHGDVPLILGFAEPTDYLSDTSYQGAIAGRVANRIGGARFDLDGTGFALNANEGNNTLHGGQDGLSGQFWDLKQISRNEVVLSYLSRDGESGFPGEVRFEVRVRLTSGRLTYAIFAQPDRPTPISVAQHNYYMLGDAEGISAHRLKLAASRFLEIDAQGIPSGRLCPVKNSALDFETPKAIGRAAQGIDHYFCFDPDRDPHTPVARLTAPSGLALNVYSDQPGAQVYSAAMLSEPFRPSAGVCIEPSGYPNAPNIPSFPSMISTPEAPYRQTLTLELSEGRDES